MLGGSISLADEIALHVRFDILLYYHNRSAL